MAYAKRLTMLEMKLLLSNDDQKASMAFVCRECELILHKKDEASDDDASSLT
jgi:hypothetical protein